MMPVCRSYCCAQCNNSTPVDCYAMQMFLERRIMGPCIAAHGVYYDEEYFRGVTGLPDVKWIHCKKTETTVR